MDSVTAEVRNDAPQLVNNNLFSGHSALREAAAREGAAGELAPLTVPG